MFPPHLLVSLSRSSLYFCFLMVDYSVDCPSISFLFAHLSGLLEVVGRQGPEVGLFVGRSCSFRFALHFLFPLVHHSVGIARHLMMSGEGEVRFSELETGLSSSEDCRAFEVTSPSTFYKA